MKWKAGMFTCLQNAHSLWRGLDFAWLLHLAWVWEDRFLYIKGMRYILHSLEHVKHKNYKYIFTLSFWACKYLAIILIMVTSYFLFLGMRKIGCRLPLAISIPCLSGPFLDQIQNQSTYFNHSYEYWIHTYNCEIKWSIHDNIPGVLQM